MFYLVTCFGKLVYRASRLMGRGHGSALPGLIIEKIYPNYLAKLLNQLPDGVVVVSGTNGKTTTTKIIADLLQADGRRVFTNASGSNFVRGVISAALPKIKGGKLPFDIAVLELDEAHAVHFVDQVRPSYSLLLNVLRDQLDRFGEIDKTAQLLNHVAEATMKQVIINREDGRLIKLASNPKIKASISYFGVTGPASKLCKDSEALDETKIYSKKAIQKTISLDNWQNQQATYQLANQLKASVKLRLFGLHSALNCGAALATLRAINGDEFNFEASVNHLGSIRPAFGRGEVITVGSTDILLVLVKNPSGFQSSLDSIESNPTLIAINDDYADGRDVSWLWDVNFDSLRQASYRVSTTGVRANDMAVRLFYDEVPVDDVEPDMTLAVNSLLRHSQGGRGQILATYTAMLKIRDLLEAAREDHV